MNGVSRHLNLKWRALVLFWVLSFLFLPLPQSALSSENPSPSAYSVLGLREGQTVAPESLRSLFLEKVAKTSTLEQRIELYSAFQTLSQPSLREQYDRGIGRQSDLSVPSSERENLARLASTISPSVAQRLRSTGLISAAFVQNMLVFYVVMGSLEAAKCVSRADPADCNAFYRSQQDWSTHVGGVAFVLGAWGGSAALQKFSGGRIPGRVAGYGGLSIGFFANELVLEFAKNPRVHNIRTLRATVCNERSAAPAEPNATEQTNPILSPKEACEKRRNESLSNEYQKLYEETLGSSEWYKDKAPLVAGLIGAAAASEATQHLLSKLIQEIEAKRVASLSPNIDANSSCPKLWAALVARQSPTFTANFSSGQLWRHNLAREFGTVALFVAWIQLLDPVAQGTWDMVTLERELRSLNSRKNFREEREFVAHLNELQKKWDLFRRKKLKDVEVALAGFNQEIVSVRKSLEDTNAFYSWIENGSKPDDEIWDTLKENYPPGTLPTDPAVQRDLDRYTRLAICGSSLDRTVELPRLLHGLSVPFMGEVRAQPYRYLEPRTAQDCAGTPPAETLNSWREAIRNGKEKREETYAKAKAAAERALNERIKGYEQRVEDLVRSAAQEQGTSRGLPRSVMGSFDEELKILNSLQNEATRMGPKALEALQEAQTQLQKKREAAEGLFNFFLTPQNQRQRSRPQFEGFFDALQGPERPEWRKAVDFFNSLMIR